MNFQGVKGAQTLNLERKVLIMKKILILLLTLSMIAAVFMGCSEKFGSSSKDTNGNGLRDDVELKIMKEHYSKWDAEDYDKFVLEDHWINYYGNFNGVYVYNLNCRYRQMSPDSNSKDTEKNYDDLTNEELFSDGVIGILAWYKNEIRSVLSLIDEGVLSEGDVSKIRDSIFK